MEENENSPEEVYGDFVTVAYFNMPYQAHLLAGNLEAEGIITFIRGENMHSVYPFLTADNNGIAVQVRESQVEAAKKIIDAIEAGATPSGDLPPVIDVDGRTYDLVKGNCLECGAPSVYLAQGNPAATIGAVAVVFAIALPMRVDHNYFCYSCHATWKD